MRPARNPIAALLLALLHAGCGGGEGPEADLPRMRIETVALSLVADPELRTVLRCRPDGEPYADSMMPLGKSHTDAGILPALVMPPPCELAFELSALEPGAALRFAAGIGTASYARDGGGVVRFEIELDGRLVFEKELATGDAVPREERVWHRDELPVAGGGRLVLRTSLVEPAAGDAEPVQAGFGLLEVIQPREVRRTRSSPERPNVLLVTIDTLRADGLHAYGNPREASPVLDRLAERGLLYEAAFATSPWTWPSTASLFTSLTPPEHGLESVDSCYLADELLTLAEVFQFRGFTTAAFSCNPLVVRDKNFDQGFELFREYEPIGEEWIPTREILDDVRAWIDEMGEFRFFLYLHVIDPHGPYLPEEDLARRWAPPRPEGLQEGAWQPFLRKMYAGEDYDAERLAGFLDYRRAMYDGEVATVDRALGEILAHLDALGLTESTVVAVTSDHGEEFLEHGMLAHGKQLFDESVRVPMILAGPGVPEGVREARPVENRFLVPTLLRLAGLPVPERLEGPDLTDLPVLARRPVEPLFLSTRLGKWIDREEGRLATVPELHGVQLEGKLFLWSPPTGGGERERLALFDLERDPRAERDLAPERPGEVAALRGLIEGWLARAESVRPNVLGGGESALELLREIGYVDSED